MKLLSINIFTDTIASFEDECFADKRGEDASTAGSGQHEPPRLMLEGGGGTVGVFTSY